MTKKRKNLKLICILTLFILINISMPSLATTKADILIETNKEYLEKGEEIELTINIEGEETAAYNFELYFDKDKLEYVSNLENARRNARIDYIGHIADTLGVSLEQLFIERTPVDKHRILKQ